jgi:thioredoxin reductase
MHGFLTRDCIEPAEFRRLAHTELGRYPSVMFCEEEVTAALRLADGFAVTLGNGRRVHSRKMLIATGVFDHLPAIEGIEKFFGTSPFPCPTLPCNFPSRSVRGSEAGVISRFCRIRANTRSSCSKPSEMSRG